MAVTVKLLGDKKFRRKLDRISRKLKNPSREWKLTSIVMQKDVFNHFRGERGPKSKWKKSRRAITQGGKTLQDTGRLRQSITTSSDRKRAIVGTNVKYARRHDKGLKGMPQRTFIWLSKKAENKILGIFINAWERA